METNYTKPLCILKASAGSGKTFRLAVQFLALLFSGKNKYRRIMAVTFTNKATAEMKQRILSVLKGFARGDWENFDAYLEAINQFFPQLSKREIQTRAIECYRQILHDYGRLTITTIDKFVQQIIRSFTFELGIDADYQVALQLKPVIDDLSERLHESLDEKPELLDWIIENAKNKINDGQNWDYQNNLKSLAKLIFNEDFQHFEEALNRQNDPQLFANILDKATATKQTYEQSLKAQFEKARTIYQEYNLPPESLKGRSKSPLNILNKNFPEYLSVILKHEGPGSMEKIIDNPEEWFAKKASDADKQLYDKLNPVLRDFVSIYYTGTSDYLLAKSLTENLYYLRLLKEMSALLKDYRVENHVLLISDATRLLEGITRGMEDNPSFIWEKTGNRFRHFLFDEFQDTSRNQWKNFQPLLKNALAEASGKATEQLIVGDVKQSIYRWRGGDWEILLRDVEQTLGKMFVETQTLQTNFRSEANIITFNNYIFGFLATWLQNHINHNVIEKGGEAFYNDFWVKNAYHQIIPEAYQDVAQLLPDNKANNQGIVDWEIIPVTSNLGRLKEIKEQVCPMIADTLYRWIVTEKRYRASQIGILVRTNDEARELLSYLEKDKQRRPQTHPYEIISGDAQNLKDNAAIQLLIATLKFLSSSGEDVALYATLCTYLQVDSQSVPNAADWIKIAKSRRKDLTGFLPQQICEASGQLLQLPLPLLVEELIKQYKLDEDFAVLPFLLAFRDCLSAFNETGENSLNAFLVWWEEQDNLNLPDAENGNNAIQIMTIHKAKGLAFDVVMLPCLHWSFDGKINNTFWVNMQNTPFDELPTANLKYTSQLAQSSVKDSYFKEQLYAYMDALNTLYVAMTRARKHLFLCIPGNNNGVPQKILAGDGLYEALENYQQTYQAPLVFPETETAEHIVENSGDEKGANHTFFATYPTCNHLEKQLTQQIQNDLQRLDNEENIRIGIAAHELLSLCQTADDIPDMLNKLYQEGWFSETERTPIRKTVEKAFHHSGLQELLQKPGEFLNEREILDETGNSHRPDKVLTSEKETLIIDFKFTGNEKQSHLEQVKSYKELFTKMGYPNVKGWLFYGFPGKLVTV